MPKIVDIKEDDKKFRKFFEQVKEQAANPQSVFAGIIGAKGGEEIPEGGKLAIVEYATLNEFGTDMIPSRPFMRQGSRNAEDLIYRRMASKAKLLGNKYTFRELLEISGLIMQKEIRKAIRDIKTPPNSPTTIQNKGSSNPLIDTGRMRQSVSFVIAPSKTYKR
jgi:hypothetical protein